MNKLPSRIKHSDAQMRMMFHELAKFRHRLRQFQRFSETAARAHDITPQQHQLLLGVAGFTGTGKATISEIADFLQERHNSVVGLVDRAVQSGLVQRRGASADRRVVVVSLTSKGERILRDLSFLHREEVNRLRQQFLYFGEDQSASSKDVREGTKSDGGDAKQRKKRVSQKAKGR
jgi:DNA-binding MarR family transcriptional regulator